MLSRYLLYIDVLGFSELVATDYSRIHNLYQIIASLNVHRHPNFKAIVFSDTILIYNVTQPRDQSLRCLLIRFLCEFAQDLIDRLTGYEIVIRAVLTKGQFTHYELNSIPCFFGPALVDAYKSEKEIKAIGLFIDQQLLGLLNISGFHTRPFNERFSFVYLTQSLERIERQYGGEFPIYPELLETNDEIWQLVPEVLMLKYFYEQSQSSLNETVRIKYENTLHLYEAQYPKTMAHLIQSSFNWSTISPSVMWKEIIKRYPEDYSWAITQQLEF